MKRKFDRLLVCALSVAWLGACAAKPVKGDIERSSESKRDLLGLIQTGQIDPHASRVNLNVEGLAGWHARVLNIAPELYQARLQSKEVNLGAPEDLLALRCKWNLETPVTYLNYQPRTQALRTDLNKVALDHGSCTQVERNTVIVVAGLYSYSDVLLNQVPANERFVRLEEALKRFTFSSFKEVEHEHEELAGMLIGQSAGYLQHDVPGLIPHSTLFEKRDNNYYRLVLIGDQTIVAFDVYGSTSTSVADLRRALWPVLQSLRYSGSREKR